MALTAIWTMALPWEEKNIPERNSQKWHLTKIYVLYVDLPIVSFLSMVKYIVSWCVQSVL